MQYEPIKEKLGNVIRHKPFFRITFYKLINLLLLRTWHIKREIKNWKKAHGNKANILDAGSGFGQYSYFISNLSKNFFIYGIDIIEEQINDCNTFVRKINRDNQLKFNLEDITKYKYPDKFNVSFL